MSLSTNTSSLNLPMGLDGAADGDVEAAGGKKEVVGGSTMRDPLMGGI